MRAAAGATTASAAPPMQPDETQPAAASAPKDPVTETNDEALACRM